MRIVAGKLRGRRLPSPGKNVRPTSERVREALMSILFGRLEGARVLDVYAGTGAFGFEALSRGAASVVFIEDDARTARQLTETAKTLGVLGEVEVVRAKAPAAIARAGGPFDLVFCDPPYADADPVALLTAAGAVVERAGLVVIETGKDTSAPLAVGALALESTRTYGETRVSVYAAIIEEAPAAPPGG